MSDAIKIFLISAVILGICVIGKAGDVKMNDVLSGFENVPQEAWDALAQKKIFFGHQSVGQNIVDGMETLMRETAGVSLNIRGTKDPADFTGPVFAHASIGKNRDPYSKIDDFRRIVESGVGDAADIAFMKLCYVDVTRTDDAEAIMDHYAEVMDELIKKYPSVRFVHCTVPLQTVSPQAKILIKKMMGKPLTGLEANAGRNMFNEMLLARYGREYVFDLAGHESTGSGGKQRTFDYRGKTYLSLAPEYTDDGGHLNQAGRKVIAGKLIRFLARGN